MECRVAGHVLCIAFWAWASASAAQTVYKCRAADGAVAYQDHACAVGAVQAQVTIEPAPPVAASPDYGRGERPGGVQKPRRGARSRVAPAARSWECRAADGGVFYRHAACPKSIAARAGGKGKDVRVTAAPIARAEACRRLSRAGAAGRAGHEHDEAISTYDRNAGRDPCRYE